MKPVRLIGAGTAAYGGFALLRPAHLVNHADLTPGAGVDVLSRVLGVRDLASGTAILAAPAGARLEAALAVRVLFDFGDAAVFGTQLPTSRARRKVAAVAAGWGIVALAGLLAERR